MTPTSIEAFLDAVCARIRWWRWREPIRTEMRAHLEDRIEYLIVQRGFTPAEAEYDAVIAMGDPAEIGDALDKQHRPFRFYGYLVTVCILLTIFLYVIYALIYAST